MQVHIYKTDHKLSVAEIPLWLIFNRTTPTHIQIGWNSFAMTKRLLDNMPRTTQMICWSLMRFAPDSPFSRGTDQLKAKHRYYTATEKHRHQPHHSLPEEKRGFCSLLPYKYCTWLYLKVRFSLMGFTGLIWQLKKLKFFNFPRIWTPSCPNSVSAQLRDKNKARKQYITLESFSRQRSH